MLALTCRVDESIVIGKKPAVTIPDAKGSQVRVGINAPPEVKTLREKLRDRGEPPGAA